MKTHLMYPELATNLRELAEDYFNGDYVEHRSGICFALRHYMPEGEGYHAMGDLMRELDYKSTYFGPCRERRESWERRAYMCLLLAECLEASA
jgi:hypothetical protein